jgi:hypothetical protein
VNVEEVIAEIEEFTKEYAAKLGVPYEDDMVSLPHLSCCSSLFCCLITIGNCLLW